MKCAVLAVLLLGAVALSHGAGDDPTVNIPGVVDLSECGAPRSLCWPSDHGPK